MQQGRIQKLSVEETANILQGLSRSGYMLKNSWNQNAENTLYIQPAVLFSQSKQFLPEASRCRGKAEYSVCLLDSSFNMWNAEKPGLLKHN